ncbi:phage Gp37/Gp68 family protein [Thioalkalivibrio sp. ALE19]|uniref:phage Gp37/Gp68 family protein n=1 Tax=Thioalkalivibrio sp. ALE19 TaxID=1266909 RepID=UPI0003F5733F|nr:phage Gp37/Gp68 family protein [Thioalkalivibrio sp. ALE19]
MAENTNIEWAHHTFNPWIGCTKVGPGCDNCYAERWASNRASKPVHWGPGEPRRRTAESNWNTIRRLERRNAEAGTRERVFVASLADWADREVPDEWRRDLFDLIAECPSLDFLLLTKRIGVARRMLPWMASGSDGTPWPNVWLGVTVANQEDAERDIDKLLATPATMRFLSMEPLVGPVDLDRAMPADAAIDWIIVGGESGPNARPMHPAWVEAIRDQCQARAIPFLFKQWGEWSPQGPLVMEVEAASNPDDRVVVLNEHGEFGSAVAGASHLSGSWPHIMLHVGKKRAGRVLGGRHWDEVPTSPCEVLEEPA